MLMLDEILAGVLPGDVKDRREEHRGHRHHKHPGIHLGGGAAEGLLLAIPSARNHRSARNQQQVAENRAGERGTNDFV